MPAKRCVSLLLALFLLELATGLVLFLPLVGRRNAGAKFYRLILLIAAGLTAAAGISHLVARAFLSALADGGLIFLIGVFLLVFRYPKRVVFLVSAVAVGVAYGVATWAAYDTAIRSDSTLLSAAGCLSTVAILGSVNLAMLLGHWYLVVRGMSIDPLKRLALAVLCSTVFKTLVVAGAVIMMGLQGGWERGGNAHQLLITQGIFFWMRVAWGLVGPLVLYPMIWGTVRIRSTMAATGILYVAVVAVVIGEVLGTYLSAMLSVPV